MNLPAGPDDAVLAEDRQVDHRRAEAAVVSYRPAVHHHCQLRPELLELLQQGGQQTAALTKRIKNKKKKDKTAQPATGVLLHVRPRCWCAS